MIEIQVGILKRLRGTPIDRHTAPFDCRYNPHPPYNLLCSELLDFATLRRLERFARYWDLTGNSGRFAQTRPILLDNAPFRRFMSLSDWLRFMSLSDWLFATTGQTHQFALERLFDWLYQGLTEALGADAAIARHVLAEDYQASSAKGCPAFLRAGRPATAKTAKAARNAATPDRQARRRQEEN